MSEVTDLMIEKASDAYMPFGDMKLALEVALIHAPSPWIPCSERMPESGEEVLICWAGTDCAPTVDVWLKDINHDHVTAEWMDDHVAPPTHWMPLPPAPTN